MAIREAADYGSRMRWLAALGLVLVVTIWLPRRASA
jgi:hypothetical protein